MKLCNAPALGISINLPIYQLEPLARDFGHFPELLCRHRLLRNHRIIPFTRTGDHEGSPAPLLPRRGNYPTEPSSCNWIRRFSSSAYSIGNSLTIGSMKPLTIMAIASSSEMPRLFR